MLTIRHDDLSGDATHALLRLHLAGMHATSPKGSVFALDLSGLQVPTVTVWTGWFGADAEVRALAYRALAAFAVWPMLTAGLVCLVTGLVLGLGTKWGLLRYWWVAVKLVLNLVLCTLILVALEPGMDTVAEYGRDLTTGAEVPPEIPSLFFPPAVSLTALTFATVLSVLKPWGRIRRRR